MLTCLQAEAEVWKGISRNFFHPCTKASDLSTLNLFVAGHLLTSVILLARRAVDPVLYTVMTLCENIPGLFGSSFKDSMNILNHLLPSLGLGRLRGRL